MADTIKTVATPATAVYKDKGRRFLAFIHPVSDLNGIKEQLDHYRKEYRDARHVCYAYVLGEEHAEFRANDDGEPSGTAGRPILGQINSFGLTNVLLVVVRYFGGILLGTGGLITAYKEAASDAIRNARIIEKPITHLLVVNFNYPLMNEVSRIIKEFNLAIHQQQFTLNCTITLAVPKTDYELVKNRFEKIYGVEATER